MNSYTSHAAVVMSTILIDDLIIPGIRRPFYLYSGEAPVIHAPVMPESNAAKSLLRHTFPVYMSSTPMYRVNSSAVFFMSQQRTFDNSP